MPSYRGHQAEEQEAIAAYQAGMPGVKVVPVNSDNSIVAGGSIHCVTQTIPVLPKNRSAGESEGKAVPVEFTPSEEIILPASPVLKQLQKLAE